ncbi:MAG: hypothetical protein ACJA0H_001188 [Francisellaceae bacterium]|jgi:hypothetical protein
MKKIIKIALYSATAIFVISGYSSVTNKNDLVTNVSNTEPVQQSNIPAFIFFKPGDQSSFIMYRTGDIVSYKNSIYQTIQAVNNNHAPNESYVSGTYWKKITKKQADSYVSDFQRKSNSLTIPDFILFSPGNQSSFIMYRTGDVASYKGSIYQVLQAVNNNHAPNDSYVLGTYWKKISKKQAKAYLTNLASQDSSSSQPFIMFNPKNQATFIMYRTGDVVTYKGDEYEAIQAINNSHAPDKSSLLGTYWNKVK